MVRDMRCCCEWLLFCTRNCKALGYICAMGESVCFGGKNSRRRATGQIVGDSGRRSQTGGERQRISIARALLKNAPIVLLDEATASLDVENETKVQGALSRLLQGKTVLVIAHRMRTVEAADKIVVLANGQVAEEGSPAELLAKDRGMFRHMTQLQASSADWSI